MLEHLVNLDIYIPEGGVYKGPPTHERHPKYKSLFFLKFKDVLDNLSDYNFLEKLVISNLDSSHAVRGPYILIFSTSSTSLDS